MECYRCTVSGKEIVYMVDYLHQKSSAVIYICPRCGLQEVTGFGKVY